MFCSEMIHLFWYMTAIVASSHIPHTNTDVCHSSMMTQFPGGVHVDCSKRQLHSVPSSLNKTTVHLDLSFNHLTFLKEGTFETLPLLVVLNLTQSDIQNIHFAAFRGLDKLEELYLSNNPALHSELPDNVFRGLISLKALYMWRIAYPTLSVVNFQAISNLETLEKLAITPNERVVLPAELRTLTNLKVLTLAFGFINNISQDILEPLSGLHLEELALYGMHINHIENGAFSNFLNLRLLNLACNEYGLTLSSIIDALSTSTNLNVSSLIVDSVGKHSKGNVLGPEDIPNCRKAWSNLKKFSARSIGPVMIIKPELLIKCFTSLELLTFSSINFFPLTSIPAGQFRNLEILRKMQLRSVDASYLQAAGSYRGRTGRDCYVSAWIPPNEDFFPPMIAADENCMQKNNALPNISESECPDPHVISLPPCLTYVDFHGFLSIEVKSSKCDLVKTNSLRFVDASGSLGHDPSSLKKRIFGLNDLEFLDAANSGVKKLGEDYFATVPALKTLILRDNFLYEPRLPFLSELPHLETLDISGNKLLSIDNNIFNKYPSLTLLNISRNFLQDASFLINSTKSLLMIDLSGNKITGLTDNVTTWLDTINHNLSINLDHNPLICSCEYLSFITWIKVTQVKITEKDNLDCIYDDQRHKLSAINVKRLHSRCDSITLKISLGAVAFSLILLFSISSLAAYKLRWKIRWRYYKMRYRSKHRNDYLLDDMTCMSRYNSYVIFSMDDDEVRPWVAHELCTKVESEWQEDPLFIPGLRDDEVGVADVDNITEGIMSSSKAIWVVSPAFFTDKHCEIAANFAFYHLGATRNMIIIWERRLDCYHVASEFRNICNRKHGIPRVSYCSDDEDGRRLFWTKLRDFISDGIITQN